MTGFEALLADAPLLPGLRAASADAAIDALAGALRGAGAVGAGYADAVRARERTMPTGLPVGAVNVAIPHADPVHVLRPAIAVATLAEPVPFRSMDDPDEALDVRVVFLLALDDKNRQIDTLRDVMALIQDQGWLGRFVAASDVDAMRATVRARLHEGRVP